MVHAVWDIIALVRMVPLPLVPQAHGTAQLVLQALPTARFVVLDRIAPQQLQFLLVHVLLVVLATTVKQQERPVLPLA